MLSYALFYYDIISVPLSSISISDLVLKRSISIDLLTYLAYDNINIVFVRVILTIFSQNTVDKREAKL
jgi:hypothetical protein